MPDADDVDDWVESFKGVAVVVETLLPIGGPGLLFEMSQKLARCAVPRQGTQLREALDRAGFSVVEVRRWGWERPHPVAAGLLGEFAASVPGAVVATGS